MDTLPSTLALVAITLVVMSVYGAYQILRMIIVPSWSPLRTLSGPSNPSFFWGNLKHIWAADSGVVHEAWTKQYGHTYVYQDPFNSNRLFTMNVKAISHILNRSEIYRKPEDVQRLLARIVGEGLLVVEGEKHKRQRRILNPAFGPAQIRNLTGIFLSKANQLRDVWLDKHASSAPGAVTVDALSWLSKATLDIIGLAGFNYSFNALRADPASPNELSEAFDTLYHEGTRFEIGAILATYIPPLRVLPTKLQRTMKRSMAVMNRIGEQLIADKKAAALDACNMSSMEKGTKQDRDILSILVRANMAKDLPESQRLSDADVLAQIPTFLVAGHETTSTATTWVLHALSLAPEFQARLREELQSVQLPTGIDEEPLDKDTLDALNALPLLDATLREVLRLWAPVPMIVRTAMVDDVVSLDTPVLNRNGELVDSFRIAKGDGVCISLQALNRSKDIWGEDAHEFNPDRWLAGTPSAASTVPGIWAHIMSFLGGPRGCIGYRFSIIEIKIILHVILTTFALRPGAPDIIRKTFIVNRPHVQSKVECGPQLPLILERLVDGEYYM